MRQFSQLKILKFFLKKFTPIFGAKSPSKNSVDFVVNHLIIE